MVDDYGGYKESFRQGVTEHACLAHYRPKFFDLDAAGTGGHPIAQEALRRIGELYAVEAQARDGDVAARLALRQQVSRRKLTTFHESLIAQRVKTANGSDWARAIDYSLKRWPALIRYVESGALPIDNNVVENAIRPITLECLAVLQGKAWRNSAATLLSPRLQLFTKIIVGSKTVYSVRFILEEESLGRPGCRTTSRPASPKRDG